MDSIQSMLVQIHVHDFPFWGVDCWLRMIDHYSYHSLMLPARHDLLKEYTLLWLLATTSIAPLGSIDPLLD